MQRETFRVETFRGDTLPRVLAEVRSALGEDAMILRTRGRSGEVEVVATTGERLEVLRARIEPGSPTAAKRRQPRPHTVALVGGTGVGKTTTIAKLALHPRGFGGRRVGLVTLDTFRVGALEQLQIYAEIIALPLEVVYQQREVADALKRLSDCDVVLVDTPGRSPRASRSNLEWQRLLRTIAPDEVHLVIPAGLRTDAALALRDAYGACGTTHLLLTKLDEVPDESCAAELADQVGLPARWVTAGQDIPTDLFPAGARLMASLCAEPRPFVGGPALAVV